MGYMKLTCRLALHDLQCKNNENITRGEQIEKKSLMNKLKQIENDLSFKSSVISDTLDTRKKNRV
jgi:hypothetical protein